MITAKIDVTKIIKEKLFKGKKGTYLNIVLIETPNGQYGDFMIKQEQTKEERAAKVQTPILGNASYIQSKQGGGSGPHQPKRPAPAPARPAFNPDSNLDEDVPF